MGWEYFNGLPGGEGRPWEWAQAMSALLRGRRTVPGVEGLDGSAKAEAPTPSGPVQKEADPDDGGKEDVVPVPTEFEYHSDGGGGSE
jgi:hypothetical protein